VIGQTLGPYEVLDRLGAGGMGEVWKAHDSRLDRLVAIKVGAERFSDRFEREARAVAALNHPNVCTLHDVGPNYLVMELVEGATLADRLRTGAIPVDEALTIARQMAEALEAAHEKGIIHRDLKPANVKVTPDGVVKVLDFGLAKALDPASGAPPARDAANSPTITSPAMTELGMILGTAAYMSPEQAMGRPVDKRADIWAFGVVLYEMLTGRPLFRGDTVSETMAAVLKDSLALDGLPTGVPRAIRRLLARCLERNPKNRLRDIGEARIVLADPDRAEDRAAPDRAEPRRRRLALLGVGAVALALAAGAVAWYARPVAVQPLRRFVLSDAIGSPGSFAVSPDGSRLAYFSNARLFVHTFDALEPQDLGPVHVTSERPFWSPDGRTIAFAAGATILKIPAAGGAVIEVCKVPATGDVLAAAWRPDDTIVFAVWRDSLYSVPATGGAPALFLAVDAATQVDFHGIAALPDNRLIVTTHLRASEPTYQLELVDARANGPRTMIASDRNIDAAGYDPRGYVVFHRSGANAGIWAAPFRDGPLDLASAVLVQAGGTSFHTGEDGTMIVRLPPAAGAAELVWLDRRGQVSPVAGAPFVPAGGTPFQRRGGMRLSRDGRRAALFIDSTPDPYLVVRDLQTGVDVRMTLQDSTTGLAAPVPHTPGWSVSDTEVIFTTGRVEALSLVARRTDGAGSTRTLVAGSLGQISPDGRYLVFVVDERGLRRLRYAPILPDGSVGPIAPVGRDADPNVSTFALSPDGAFLAYGVVEADRRINTFLTRFPGGDGRWQVTSTGGAQPTFSRDGTELFYLAGSIVDGRPTGILAATPIALGPVVKLGAPVTVFEEGKVPAGVILPSFDVAPDGRFLMLRLAGSNTAAPARMVLIQNWRAVMSEP
jgi:serine/threonine-protein kinase